MLKKLFRPKWQHKDANVRLQAIQALDPIKDSEILQQVSISDSDESVRQLAISRTQQLEQLKSLYEKTPFSYDKAHIQSCWCSVLADPSLTPALQAESIVLDCQDPSWLAAIVRYSNSSSLKHLALTGLQDESVIFQLLESTKDSLLWQRLIEQLHSEQALRKALELIKGRDKKTTQILRQRIDSLVQQEQTKQILIEQRTEIEGKLKQLLKSDHTPLMEGMLINFQQQLENADLASEKSLHLLAQCQEKFRQQQKQEQAQQEQASAINLAESLLDQFSKELSFANAEEQQLNELKTHNSLLVKEIVEKISQLQQTYLAYQQLEQAISNESSKAKKYALIEQALQLLNRNKMLKQHFHSAMEQQAKQYKQLKKEELKQQQQHKIKLHSIIEQADNALANRDFALLNKLHTQAKQGFKQLSDDERVGFHAAMQRIQAAAHELQQRQEFATDPIREELCQAMEKLIDSKEPANIIAQSIKDIQQQWKNLGYCHDQALWQRFRELTEQAYAPCKVYFAEQRERKRFNAEQCQTICEQVEQFSQTIDWKSADYRSLDRLLKSIDKEWKQYNVLERKDYHKLNQRYRDARNILDDKLKQHKRGNTEQLEKLVQQAKTLLDLDDANMALQEYQNIHETWKTVGISFFKTQQTLWQQLRDIGDTIYQQRSSQRNEAEEALQANAQLAQTLIDKIKQATQADQVEQYQQEFATLGMFPKNRHKKIQLEFHAAIDNFYQQQEKNKLKAQITQLDELLQWQGIKPLDHWPSKWKEALEQRTEATEDGLRTLCIEAEILADIASPKEDEALRMQIQMQQLQAHFSQGEASNILDQLSQLILTWVGLNKQNIADPQLLQTRFNTTIKAIKENL